MYKSTELVARIAKGDERALGALYDLHADRVYNFAFAITGDAEAAEAAVSAAFAQVWRDADAFMHAGAGVLAWLIDCVHRHATSGPHQPAIGGTGAARRRIFELAHLGGLTTREIAAVVGEAEVDVRIELRGALDALRGASMQPAPTTT